MLPFVPTEEEWLDADIVAGDAAGPWQADPDAGIAKMSLRLTLLKARLKAAQQSHASDTEAGLVDKIKQVEDRLAFYTVQRDGRN